MSMQSIHIKKAHSDDAPLLSELIRLSFRDVARRFALTPENCPKHPSNCTTEWIERSLAKGATYYLLEKAGKTAGCFALKPAAPDLYFLERLAVYPRNRRKGLGRAMVDHALMEAGRLGAKQLGIGIISDDVELERWFKKIGFVKKETKALAFLPFTVTFMTYQF